MRKILINIYYMSSIQIHKISGRIFFRYPANLIIPIACAECNYNNAYEYYFILWFNSTYEYSILAVADGVRDREGSH